jgi:hypothetical protein
LVVIRHITQESADQFLRDLLLELGSPLAAGLARVEPEEVQMDETRAPADVVPPLEMASDSVAMQSESEARPSATSAAPSEHIACAPTGVPVGRSLRRFPSVCEHYGSEASRKSMAWARLSSEWKAMEENDKGMEIVNSQWNLEARCAALIRACGVKAAMNVHIDGFRVSLELTAKVDSRFLSWDEVNRANGMRAGVYAQCCKVFCRGTMDPRWKSIELLRLTRDVELKWLALYEQCKVNLEKQESVVVSQQQRTAKESQRQSERKAKLLELISMLDSPRLGIAASE